MKDRQEQEFADLLAAVTGICIRAEDRQRSFRKISERLRDRGAADLEDYLRGLKADVDGSRREWPILASLLTSAETYFFRDKDQLALLREKILPERIRIKRRRNDRSLRIWSAGCSTGEEPYSIAIMLKEMLIDPKEWKVLVLGTDINEEAIEKAKKGLYPAWSLRSMDANLKRRFFTPRKDSWELDEEIRKKVTFRAGNLVRDDFPLRTSELHGMDLILCRNVFIYFREEITSRVVEKMKNTLDEGGYLVTGHCELGARDVGMFQSRITDNYIVYQKASAGEPPPPPTSRTGHGAGTTADGRRKTVAGGHGKGKPLPSLRSSGAADRNAGVAAARRDLDHGSCAAAIAKAGEILKESPADLDAHFILAAAYADLGDYDSAVRICKAAMEIEPAYPEPYFLLAQIEEAKGHVEEAKDLLKKTIFLDPNHVAAYLELGELYSTGAASKQAARMLYAARDLLKELPPGAPVAPYHHMTAGELLAHVGDALDEL